MWVKVEIECSWDLPALAIFAAIPHISAWVRVATRLAMRIPVWFTFEYTSRNDFKLSVKQRLSKRVIDTHHTCLYISLAWDCFLGYTIRSEGLRHNHESEFCRNMWNPAWKYRKFIPARGYYCGGNNRFRLTYVIKTASCWQSRGLIWQNCRKMRETKYQCWIKKLITITHAIRRQLNAGVRYV